MSFDSSNIDLTERQTLYVIFIHAAVPFILFSSSHQATSILHFTHLRIAIYALSLFKN